MSFVIKLIKYCSYTEYVAYWLILSDILDKNVQIRLNKLFSSIKHFAIFTEN